MADTPIHIIILAAGTSSRLGQPKQLLPFAETTLLNHVITAGEHVAPTSVILGAHHQRIHKSILSKTCTIIENKAWASGMSTSVHAALQHITRQAPDTSAIIFTVCDQPFITSEIFSALINRYHDTQSSIVAAKYDSGHIGVPALITASHYDALRKLQGDQGARKLIRSCADIATIPFDRGNIDIDTAEDLRYLID